MCCVGERRNGDVCFHDLRGTSSPNNQDDPEILIPDSQDDLEIDDFGRLWMTMQATIQYLQEHSRTHNIIGLDSGEMPLSLSYWRLLCRVNVDWITRRLMEAIPPVVRKLFEKDTIELEDRLTLPDGESEDRTGIYVFIVKEGETEQGDLILAVYVGSSVKIGVRIKVHKRPSRWLIERRSRLYQKLMEGKTAHALVLAAFDTPVQRGYLNLLEGLFMIFLGTLQKPVFSNFYVRSCVCWRTRR